MSTIHQFLAPFSQTKSSKTVLPDALPNGEVLQDIAKKKWILGPSIGVGGFGEIYAASEFEGSKKSTNHDFVIKIEPHENGPLFCEMHFFVRCAKPEMIKNWCTENKIDCLGMPQYLGSGSHEFKGKKYRFLVMDRYGKDLWHIFLENKRQFPVATVYKISLQLIDVLEYIHSVGYVHADIKGANILVGNTKKTQNQIYLVDYGLVSKFTKKDYQFDPRKAHNGTIEYTSRDAHDGVPTRRGDIEILGYNMIQWMGTVLPWEKNLTNPSEVQNSKKKYMDDISGLLNICFGKKTIPGALKDFLNYITTMKFDTEPDYEKLRNILKKGIKNEGSSVNAPLEFKSLKRSSDVKPSTQEKKQKLSPRKQKQESDEEVPVKKSRGRKKEEKIEVEVVTNGYTAEMLRLQQKIDERKTGKKSAKKTASSTSNIIDESEDIIEGTPPEKIVPRKKKNVTTPTNGETRSLRTRR